MFRKFLVCMACVAMLLAACAPSPAPASTAAPSESGKLSFMISADPEEQAAFQKLVDAFETKYPDIRVDVINVPGEEAFNLRLIADLVTGAPADIVLFDYERLALYYAKNALEPLGPYLAQSQVIHAEDFYSQALEPFKWQGQIMCIPLNLSSDAVYYNQALFDAAQIDYPRAGWTWDDFLKDAQALTRADAGQYGTAVGTEFPALAPFIWQNGGALVDNPTRPSRLALDTPEATAALQWVVDWSLKYHVIPTQQEEKAQDSRSRFLAGHTAMFFASRKFVATMRVTAQFDWDVAPLPQGKQAANVLHSDGYCVPAQSKHKAAAWKFVEYANSIEGQTLLAATGRTVPSLRSVAESAAFLDPNAKPVHARVWLDQIPALHMLPVISTWGEIEESVPPQFTRALYGDAPLADVLRAIVDGSAPAVAAGKTP
jgi:multiple sugar transport system substrate-binding protein